MLITRVALPRFTTIDTGHPLTDTLLTQLGGYGASGAILLTGGTQVQCFDNNNQLPTRRTSDVDNRGIDAEVFVRWRVNAGSTRRWIMHVALEPDDAYTVRLYSDYVIGAGIPTTSIEVLGERADVYFEDLINVCDALYTAAIRQEYGFDCVPLD